MQNYTQEDILAAWKAFVDRGIILKDNVRPIVARSWLRCKKHGLDPWSSSFQIRSEKELKKIRTQYAEFRSTINPLLNYVCALLDNNVSLCTPAGFVYELVSPFNNYPRTLGTFVEEATCGNGAITICINEQVPIRTDGYEHYRLIAHSTSSVSTPIKHNNTVFSILTVVSFFGTLPENALQTIIAAGKIIEYLLAKNNKSPNSPEIVHLFKEMIDYCAEGIVVLDQNGLILHSNKVFAELIKAKSDTDLAQMSLDVFLTGKSVLSTLLDNELPNSQDRTLRLRTLDKATVDCHLIRKKQIGFANGDNQTILLLEKASVCRTLPDNIEQKNRVYIPDASVEYIGQSSSWLKVHEMVVNIAAFPSNVLLLGESGTGKEVVAQTIHKLSKRKGNFVAINCGAIPKDLLYSELFGYERGAFTGAHLSGAIGKFEHAHEGTIFLDEIGEMPLNMQVSLLRFIQERTVTRIGSNKTKPVDVRIIAATNKNLSELIKLGQFREDLYYRLSVVEIILPPLRERKGDIALLAKYFISKLSQQFNVPPIPLTQEILNLLFQYDWPGNVRELKNVMEKALILSRGQDISPKMLPSHISQYIAHLPKKNSIDSHEAISEQELIQLLKSYNYNITKTAKALQITRNTLYRKIEKYNIKLKTSVIQDSL